MEDRFIGYRGSQENEWSWEPERPSGSRAKKARGSRTLALAVLSASALVAGVVAVIALAVKAGDDNGNGGAVAVTTTAKPSASATARVTPTLVPPTSAPTATLAPTASPRATAKPTATVTPVPGTPRPSASLFLWNANSEAWQSRDLAQASGYSEGDAVPFLLKVSGLEPGESYTITIDLFDCGLSPERAFDYLTSTVSAGDEPLLTAPGPGRTRPDAQVPVPDDPDITGDGGGAAHLAVWGGSFATGPRWVASAGSCPDDQRLSLQVLAQSPSVLVVFGAHLATADDWPNGGASEAGSPFGVSAAVNGLADVRLQVSGSAISR